MIDMDVIVYFTDAELKFLRECYFKMMAIIVIDVEVGCFVCMQGCCESKYDKKNGFDVFHAANY